MQTTRFTAGQTSRLASGSCCSSAHRAACALQHLALSCAPCTSSCRYSCARLVQALCTSTAQAFHGTWQVSVSQEFREFVREQLDQRRRNKRDHAFSLARRGLEGTPPLDTDAISVPDTTTPDATWRDSGMSRASSATLHCKRWRFR